MNTNNPIQRQAQLISPRLKRAGRLAFVLLGLAFAIWELRHFTRELLRLRDRS